MLANSGIEERPLITRIDNNNIHFKDGTIILCNGYRYQLPFLGDDLRLKNSLAKVYILKRQISET
jgi:nitrogen fixation protein